MGGQKLVIGSRGSKLSMIQTDIVVRKLKEADSSLEISIEKIKTLNEKIDRAKETRTEKDIYTKEIDAALADGSIDIAVHSLKDLNLILPKGISIGAIADRDDPRDAFVSRDGSHFESMPAKSLIGTSSIRRKAQLLALNPSAEIVELHGNIDSRLKKLDDSTLDGIAVAAAGLKRLGVSSKVQYFSVDQMVPAIGQGAIAVTAMEDNVCIMELLNSISVESASIEVEAEREFGKVFGVGCNAPIGANARLNGNTLSMIGFISDSSGRKALKSRIEGSSSEAKRLGRELAERMIASGGDELVGSRK
jgi:hydroxymethylbilane synthase